MTVSDDKTARVWSLPDNRLISVLRVPIGDGNLGKLYAVAMTPDGETVAIGGYTGENANHNVYIFDRSSGALRQRLSGLPNIINHLAYSTDGSLLVAALAGQNGIRVFDAAHGYKPLPSDTDYADRSYWAEFDPQGNLVTTSYDGFVRLYASGGYHSPIGKVKPSQIKLPFSAVFSPDGRQIAVGGEDTTNVVVLSGKDLATIRAVAGEDLSTPGWSIDGRYLFAGGQGNDFKIGAGRAQGRANISILTLAPIRSCS